MNASSSRLLWAAVAAALAVGAVLWLAASGPGGGPGASGTFRVEIVGRGGSAIFDGSVAAADATPLSLLLLAAERGGFDVFVRGSGCTGAYVEAVAGQAEEGAGGWVYRIRDGAGWRTPGVGAACAEAGLQGGDHVRWEWSDRGEGS